MNKIIRAVVAVFMLSLMVFALHPQQAAAQINVFQPCTGVSDISVCRDDGGKLFGQNSVWNRILTTLTFIIGAVSVLMIVIGALRYTLSGGDEKATVSAKNTIIYSIVGLILAVMANAIVNFVLVNI